MSTRVRCVCETPNVRNIRSNGGDLLAQFCTLCTLPLLWVCPVCHEGVGDMDQHRKAAHPEPAKPKKAKAA